MRENVEKLRENIFFNFRHIFHPEPFDFLPLPPPLPPSPVVSHWRPFSHASIQFSHGRFNFPTVYSIFPRSILRPENFDFEMVPPPGALARLMGVPPPHVGKT